MSYKRLGLIGLLMLIGNVTVWCQADGEKRCGVALKKWGYEWNAECEAESYITEMGDTLDIVAPMGLTLWRVGRMQSPMEITYRARVIVNGGAHDRLSDLNCFWMAKDPKHADDIMFDSGSRRAVFNRCYALELYYVGYGGNRNSTTRFRRYTGDERGIREKEYRPTVLKEYTDSAHLLKANHWYEIKITAESNGRTTYTIDGETLVDYVDTEPLTEGWYGFRTTHAHVQITDFRVRALTEERKR